MHTERRELDTGDGQLGLYLTRPDGDGPFPLVMFFHHGPGHVKPRTPSLMRVSALRCPTGTGAAARG